MWYDLIFRRGDPTNDWQRASGLKLNADLDVPSLLGVPLGGAFDRLSCLGRSSQGDPFSVEYFDLGLCLDRDDNGNLCEFQIVLDDDVGKCKPYPGTVSWEGVSIPLTDLTLDKLPDIFGEWYWLDEDDHEFIAFYEYPNYEMQIECFKDRRVKRFVLCQEPLMAFEDQREAFKVTKAWPPEFPSR
ncbi:hypothetical protein AB1L30_12735 [Bremerella sp. JC817]|uniref:hypothetical protein n=1 Tax=Bremerella sp. JC817 TaxID=3231756 RepID=UPI003458D872